jgi:uncharacterized protein
MNIQSPLPTSQGGTPQKHKVIDCDIHPMLKTPGHIRDYLPQRWRDHFDTFGNNFRIPFAQGELYPKIAPYLSRRDAVPPNGGPPGSDLPFLREQLLDLHNVETGVLQVISPNGSNQQNTEFGAAICHALNEWQIAEWTSQEPRLRATLLLPVEHPEAAIAELEARASQKDFVQISVPQRCIEPLGRRRYWPILEAAAASGLPLGLHTGGQNGVPPSPGAGWPSYYAEHHHLISLATQSLVTSLIMEGVFERFPRLRVILIEGGFTWVPALGWRLDKLWHKLRGEVPHVKRPPSEYLREHFWFSTQPMDEFETPEHLRQTIEWIGWDRLVFSSDYPHWDFDDSRYAFPLKLTIEQQAGIFYENAKVVYGL